MIYKIYVESIPLFELLGGAMNWTAFDVDILSEYGQDWTVADISVCQLQMSRHIVTSCDATLQIQTQTSSSLGKYQEYKFKSCSRGVMVTAGTIAWPGVYKGMMILLVFYCPAHSGYLQFTRAPCMPGTGAVIELYGRQYQNITGIMIALVAPGAPLPSPYGDTMIAVIRTETKWSPWQGLGDTNTNNDNSDQETSQTSHPD